MQQLGGINTGTLSEISVIDMTRSCVVAKPPGLSWVQAAAVPLVSLTAKTLLSPPYLILPPSANPDPIDASSHRIQPTIVVLGGSSSVGQYVVQLAKKRLHFKVIATCSKRNIDFIKEFGADEVIDYTAEDVVQRVKDLRPAEGFVQIVDCVGGTDFLPHLPTLLSPRTNEYPAGGSYQTIVGDKTSRLVMGGSILYLTRPTMFLRMLKGWAGIGYRYSCIMLNATRRDWLAELGRLVHDEELRVEIDSEWQFEEVEKAFEKLNTGKARGKLVVHVKRES